MASMTLNQLLAENLAALMAAKKVSANQLGAQAGLSPRTLANYLKKDHNPTSTGKERSAKLTEVEKLATALAVPPIELLAPSKDAKEAESLKLPGSQAGPYVAKEPTVAYQLDRVNFPFKIVDFGKVKALSNTQLVSLETALLLSAMHLGLDIAAGPAEQSAAA